MTVGHRGLGGELGWKSKGVDKNPKGGEEDIGGVEGVVRCKSFIFRRLENQSEGRGGWRHWRWRAVSWEPGLGEVKGRG